MIEQLSAVPFLKDLSATELASSMAYWSEVELSDGQELWSEGGLATELGVVLEGELVASSAQAEVGRVGRWELTGEASSFFRGEKRSASLRAVGPVVVAVLPVKALIRLRREGSPVYDALLDQALLELVRRIRATDQRIAGVAHGDRKAPGRNRVSTLVRMWRRLKPGGPSDTCPPLVPILARLPTLRGADRATLEELAGGFVAQSVQEGEILFLEGDPGASAYLLAQGRVEVLRNVRSDRAERLASLVPGHIFGANTLVESGARTASCVAAEAGWLYRMDAESFSRPTGRVGRLWKESVLATLAVQLRIANTALNSLVDAEPNAGRSLANARRGDLLRARANLESAEVSDAHLGGLDRD